MGKGYTPLKINGLNFEKAYYLLRHKEVIEASEEKYFNSMPLIGEIEDMEIGFSGTKESIIKLKNGGYVVVKGTIGIKKVGL